MLGNHSHRSAAGHRLAQQVEYRCCRTAEQGRPMIAQSPATLQQDISRWQDQSAQMSKGLGPALSHTTGAAL